MGLTGAGRGHEGLGARTSARGSPLLLGDLPHYVQICRRGEPKALFCFAKGWIFGTIQGTTDFRVVLFWVFLHKGVS